MGLIAVEYYSRSAPETPGRGTTVAVDGKGPEHPAQPAKAAVEEFVVQNLDFFQDYEVVSNFELLREIERVESQAGSTGI